MNLNARGVVVFAALGGVLIVAGISLGHEMTAFSIALLLLTVWLVIGLCLGLIIGGAAKLRDQYGPHE